ncbi:M12 family metallopeptidase [Geodermatophilus sp. SYSU D00710]
MNRTRTCTTRLLPKAQRVEAARYAATVYTKNLPAGTSIDDLEGGGADRLAVVVNKWWGPSVDLTVGFLDNPSRQLRDKIMLHLNAWARDACVRFHEVETDPVVRISRLSNTDLPGFGGYWSYVGTDVAFIPDDEPTMNFEGFTASTTDTEFDRVVRHEAGHTLGFPHEHMRRELVERLDREKVIAAYVASQGWTEQEVIDQVLTPLEEASILGTHATDETSIMCYQIDGELTIDSEPILGGMDINEADHRFAALVYSGHGE